MRKTDVVSWRHTHAAANSSRKRRNASAARTGTSRGRRRGRRRPIRVAQARRRGCGREVRRCAKQTWRDEPQGTTRVSACALRCNVRAEHQGRLGHHPAWSHTWDIRNAHIPSECAHPTVRLACVRALLCMQFARVRVWRGSDNGMLRMGERGPAIADGCAGVPAVGVATVAAREGVALVLAARTQGAQEGTPDR
jgi:hypothetical protein